MDIRLFYFSLLMSLAFFIGTANGQKIPACVNACFFKVDSEIKDSSCGSISLANLDCFCSEKNVRDKVYACARKDCSPEDQASAMTLAMEACDSVDAPLPSTMAAEITGLASSVSYSAASLPSNLKANATDSNIPTGKATKSVHDKSSSTGTATSTSTSSDHKDNSSVTNKDSLKLVSILFVIGIQFMLL